MAGFDLTRFGKRGESQSLLRVVPHIAVVVAPIYIAALVGPSPLYLLLWVWFGLAMNGLLNLLHECAHYHAFRSRPANDLLGRWIVGPLAAADFDSYRERHWAHHRRLGEADDPKTTYHADIRGRKALGYIVSCLCLIEGLRRFSVQTSDSPLLSKEGDRGRSTPDQSATLPTWLIRVAVFQTIFSASVFAVAWSVRTDNLVGALGASVAAYLLVYVYGLTSLTVLAAGGRAIAEHQIGADNAKTTGRAALRNFRCGVVSRLVFGAYGFGEHATHHLYPALPYYHLERATAELAENDPSLIPQRGYVATLYNLASRPE